MPPTQRQQEGPLNDNQARNRYGLAMALINSDPSLLALWNRAKKGRWAAEKFQTELQKTKWYKNHAETWRRTETQYRQDRKTFNAEVAATLADLRVMATAMGAVISEDALKDIADDVYRFGYNQSQIRPLLAAYVKIDTEAGDYTGDSYTAVTELRQLAQANGQTYSDNWYLSAAKAIAAGTGTIADYEAQIRTDAAGQYGLYKDRILAGEDVTDLVSNYRAKYAQMLELDPEQVKLDDPLMQKALTAVDPKTGEPAVMTLADFTREVKKDARWAYTDNARDEISGTLYSVGRMMGLA